LIQALREKTVRYFCVPVGCLRIWLGVSRIRFKVSSALGRSGRVSLTRRQRSWRFTSTRRVVSSAMSSPLMPAPGCKTPYERITLAPGSLRIVYCRFATFCHTCRACAESSALMATIRVWSASNSFLCCANSRN